MLQLIRSYALDSKFVVADVDFSPERRLFGSGDEAIATYRELARNMSTQTRPDGNALPTIIEKWISGVQAQVALENAEAAGSPGFIHAVQQKIVHTLSTMREMVHGFDFAQVINAYYGGISWVTMISRITPFVGYAESFLIRPRHLRRWGSRRSLTAITTTITSKSWRVLFVTLDMQACWFVLMRRHTCTKSPTASPERTTTRRS